MTYPNNDPNYGADPAEEQDDRDTPLRVCDCCLQSELTAEGIETRDGYALCLACRDTAGVVRKEPG